MLPQLGQHQKPHGAAQTAVPRTTEERPSLYHASSSPTEVAPRRRRGRSNTKHNKAKEWNKETCTTPQLQEPRSGNKSFDTHTAGTDEDTNGT
jgi:hypothetical protein